MSRQPRGCGWLIVILLVIPALLAWPYVAAGGHGGAWAAEAGWLAFLAVAALVLAAARRQPPDDPADPTTGE